MKRVKRICAVALPIVALATAPLFAEVKTKDKSQFKLEGMLGRVVNFIGGKAAKEGVVGTSAVKGNRKATMNESIELFERLQYLETNISRLGPSV